MSNPRIICVVLLMALVVLPLALLPAPAQATTTNPAWYSTSWKYRKRITIDYTKVSSGPHTSFPVLVNLTSDTDLAADGQADGDDILFTSSDGTTKLDHEIEKYTSATGALSAWVRVPSLSSTADTVLYMYYGNAAAANQQNVTGVWDANYKGVWHLKESGSGAVGEFAESTSNANNGQGGAGTASRTPAQSTSGKMGNAQDYDGVDDYIQAPTSASLEITGNITLSAWVNHGASDNQIMIAKPYSTASHSSPYFDYSLHLLWNDTPRFWLNAGGSSTNVTSSTITPGTWAYLVGTYDGTTMRIYRNGVEGGSTEKSGAIANNAQPLRFGDNGGLTEPFNNLMDEVRISSTARSAGWIATEYNNQNSPSTFYSVGVEQVADWNSHTDSGRADPEDNTFNSSYTTVYMKGTGLADVSYLIAYYDAGGTKRGSETVSASGGTLNSAYVTTSDTGAAAGTWHALVQPSSGYTAFGTDSYATITAAPDTYGLLANDSFTVEASAIPEFSTVLGTIGVGMLCLGVYWLLRRRRLAHISV